MKFGEWLYYEGPKDKMLRSILDTMLDVARGKEDVDIREMDAFRAMLLYLQHNDAREDVMQMAVRKFSRSGGDVMDPPKAA